jgi:hypothetical protein
MNCGLAEERVALFVYGALADDQLHELEQHLAGCAACRDELEQVRALESAMALHPVAEPPPNLLARSRVRLEEALDALPARGWADRLLGRLRNGAASLRSAPVAASVLLLAGLSAGGLGGYRYAQRARVPEAEAAAGLHSITDDELSAGGGSEGGSRVAAVSSVTMEPVSGNVQVQYMQATPQVLVGAPDDPRVRQMLLLASRNSPSSGVRDHSVQILAAGCRQAAGCGVVRDALMVALRYDQDAGVRTKALEGLEHYIGEDMRVRDAVLETILNDQDPGVRMEAITVISPVRADSSVRQVLATVAARDRDPSLRDVSRQALQQLPDIQ